MAFCSICGNQVLPEAAFCGSCGASVVGGTPSPMAPLANNTAKVATNSLDKKFHITFICAASIAVLLLYTTFNFALIGAATGVSFGLSIRLFISHKKKDFRGTKKLDWLLLVIASTAALILMLAEVYVIQALLLIFVAVRALIMYFNMNSNDA